MRKFAWIGLLLLVSACAIVPPGPVDEARKRYAEGQTEEALAIIEQAAKEKPGDPKLRAEQVRMRELALYQWLAQAEALRGAGQLEAAEALYRRVQQLEPANARARSGLAQTEAERRHRGAIAAAEMLVRNERYREAQDVLRPVLAENPSQREARRLQRAIDDKLVRPVILSAELRPPNPQPITLELRDVTVRNIFDVLQRTTGVTFIFDRDVRTDQRASIALRNASIEEAIRMAALTTSLEHKVLNESSVFMFPSTPQKMREYQELVVKGFYLANADVKQTANMIRTLVKTRDIFIDEKIGLLVIKDTPAAIRLAERLIAAQDLAEPEVMLEVEVLEVSRSRLQELGLRFPDTLSVGITGAEGRGTATLEELRSGNSGLVTFRFSDPLFLLSLRQQDGATTVLANPRIRVKNKDKARVHIGDRVPVITTTAAATGGFVSESVTYLDVGLKLEVEPQIFLDDEVGIKVGLEVSNIAREVRSVGSSTLTYQIGTRNAATNLRLRDGETQVLAGLISDEDRKTADRVPGLGELPVAGRLFSHTRDSVSRTEIILLITPRLARTLARPEAGSIEFAAGTEAATGARPAVVLPVVPGSAPIVPPEPPAAPGAPAQAPVAPPIVPFGGMQPPAPSQ
ncbi:MAG TPA: secretin N-terminal domain-containing protein [Burkholderiales bacterium]|nr:secretin N-terminal domain-containing protein [Burkholderiales bacterium]